MELMSILDSLRGELSVKIDLGLVRAAAERSIIEQILGAVEKLPEFDKPAFQSTSKTGRYIKLLSEEEKSEIKSKYLNGARIKDIEQQHQLSTNQLNKLLKGSRTRNLKPCKPIEPEPVMPEPAETQNDTLSMGLELPKALPENFCVKTIEKPKDGYAWITATLRYQSFANNEKRFVFYNVKAVCGDSLKRNPDGDGRIHINKVNPSKEEIKLAQEADETIFDTDFNGFYLERPVLALIKLNSYWRKGSLGEKTRQSGVESIVAIYKYDYKYDYRR